MERPPGPARGDGCIANCDGFDCPYRTVGVCDGGAGPADALRFGDGPCTNFAYLVVDVVRSGSVMLLIAPHLVRPVPRHGDFVKTKRRSVAHEPEEKHVRAV